MVPNYVLCQVEASLPNTQELSGEPHFCCFGVVCAVQREVRFAFRPTYRFLGNGKWPSANLKSLFHFENDHGLIVKNFRSGGELVCCPENSIHNLSRGAARVFSDDVLHAAASKRFIF